MKWFYARMFSTFTRKGLALRCSGLCAVGKQAMLDPAGKQLEQQNESRDFVTFLTRQRASLYE